MNHVRSTLDLYAAVLRESGSALRRSGYAVGVLALFFVVFTAASGALTALDGGGLASGLALGLLRAGGVGWYLALIAIAVRQRRSVRLDDVQERVGHHLWDVITIGFIFWIAEMLLLPFLQGSLWVVIAVASVVFNPAPELIYQGRSTGLELLADAARFMQSNWPEWLGLHLLAWAGLTAWAAFAYGTVSPATGLFAAQMFGPFFGFIMAGGYAWALLGSSLAGVLSFVGLLAFVHWFMIARGLLYARLATSSRRGRAWQSRM